MKGINATTGVFGSREELERKVVQLFRQNLATTVISKRCGVSSTTVRRIVDDFKNRNQEGEK